VTFVLDASVAIACALSDESSERAAAVLSRLTATEADAAVALRSLVGLPITSMEPEPASLLSIAQSTGLSVYDSSYLALSLSRGLPLATFDDRLAAAAVKAGVAILG
jgi:predicted nucleic acid-binding protein